MANGIPALVTKKMVSQLSGFPTGAFRHTGKWWSRHPEMFHQIEKIWISVNISLHYRLIRYPNERHQVDQATTRFESSAWAFVCVQLRVSCVWRERLLRVAQVGHRTLGNTQKARLLCFGREWMDQRGGLVSLLLLLLLLLLFLVHLFIWYKPIPSRRRPTLSPLEFDCPGEGRRMRFNASILHCLRRLATVVFPLNFVSLPTTLSPRYRMSHRLDIRQ